MSVEASDFRRIPVLGGTTGPLLAATGFTVWTGLAVWAGMAADEPTFALREARNTNAYFLLGLPLMATAVAAAGYQVPERCWQWPLWLVAGHQVGMMVGGLGMQSGLSLLILSLIIATLLAIAFAVPALIGSQLARRGRARARAWAEVPVPQPVQLSMPGGTLSRTSQTAPAQSASAEFRKSPPRSRTALRPATAAPSGNR